MTTSNPDSPSGRRTKKSAAPRRYAPPEASSGDRDDRRTLRIADELWIPGQVKAGEHGDTITDVMRRLLAEWLLDGADPDLGYITEYCAIPKTGNRALAVEGIRGDYDEVRRLFPPALWQLKERDVSPYRDTRRPGTRTASANATA
ncbi:hypothetical protein ACNQR7_32055 [Mycolicibacterium senegalense]|uniref:hypothetical protein n=1 Tax=Mycolicibacterium senegalense TaxID=1796 RepID=UPI003AAEE231